METIVKTLNRLLGLILLAVFVNFVTNFKLQANTTENSIIEVVQKQRSYVNSGNVDRTLDCLAMNVYKEAGLESFEGKVAVAQVTLNRVDHPGFPKDVCAVVYQKNVIMEKVICQFSWHCMNNGGKKPSDKNYKESYAVAKKVLLEGFRLETLKDALYFHATHVHPQWRLQKIAQIGNHIFYRRKT